MANVFKFSTNLKDGSYLTIEVAFPFSINSGALKPRIKIDHTCKYSMDGPMKVVDGEPEDEDDRFSR